MDLPPGARGTHRRVPVAVVSSFGASVSAVVGVQVVVALFHRQWVAAAITGAVCALAALWSLWYGVRRVRLESDGVHLLAPLTARTVRTVAWAEVVGVDPPTRWRTFTVLRRHRQAPVEIEGIAADDARALRRWLGTGATATTAGRTGP